MKKFCKGCQIKIQRPTGFEKLLNKDAATIWEFEDGEYCDACGKTKYGKLQGTK